MTAWEQRCGAQTANLPLSVVVGACQCTWGKDSETANIKKLMTPLSPLYKISKPGPRRATGKSTLVGSPYRKRHRRGWKLLKNPERIGRYPKVKIYVIGSYSRTSTYLTIKIPQPSPIDRQDSPFPHPSGDKGKKLSPAAKYTGQTHRVHRVEFPKRNNHTPTARTSKAVLTK